MIDLVTIGGAAAVLLASHAWAFRIGASRAPQPVAAPEPTPQPVLVVSNDTPAHHAIKALQDDFAALPDYVQTLLRQIDGVKQDTEDGIGQVIDEVDAINGQARAQITKMHASLDGSQALTRSSERPQEIITSLQTALDARTVQIKDDFDRLTELAQEFDTVRPIIESISTIADKAFFLSINAAVEAARAGTSGAAFGLVANEMRALATMTQTASKEIGAGISTFTHRIHEELDRARPKVEGADHELRRLMGELTEMQGSMAGAGRDLSAMIQSMDAGHREMVDHLSSILGHVQFQDIIRQRLDQVGEAVEQLGHHIGTNVELASTGQTAQIASLHALLDAQQSRYVMHSQRAAFAAVAGGGPTGGGPMGGVMADSAPRIELF
jgi:methyl-accepting chemotaxis protein